MTSTSTGPLQPLLRNSCTSGPCHGLDLLASVGALWHLSQSPRVKGCWRWGQCHLCIPEVCSSWLGCLEFWGPAQGCSSNVLSLS